jgi:hypothetical protein
MFLCVKKKYTQGLRNDVIIQSYYSKNKDKMVLLNKKSLQSHSNFINFSIILFF